VGLIFVLKRPDYIFLTALATLIVFLALTFFSNMGILGNVIFDGALLVSVKIKILVNIPYGYVSEFSSRSLTVVLFSLLFGINLSGIVYYVRLYKATALSAMAALGSGSILSAIIGVSCISCGSLATIFLASLFGASSLAIILPLSGTELSLISITLLLVSIVLIDKKIKQAWSR